MSTAKAKRGVLGWLGGNIAAGGKAWVAVWDHREPATSLALTRMLVALAILGDLLAAYHLGLVEAVWSPPPDGFSNMDLRNPSWVIRVWGAGPETAWIAWGLTVGFCVAVFTGTFTRVSCVALAVMSAQLAYMAPDGDRGIDKLLRVVLLVLALSGSHAKFSVDAVIRRRIFKRPIGGPLGVVSAWPRYLLFLQLIWLYFVAGVAKAGGGWNPVNGLNVLTRIWSDPHLSKVDPDTAASLWPVGIAFTAGTLLFECGAFAWILAMYWDRTRDRPGRLRRWSNKLRLRWVFMISGIGLHLGIAMTLRLGMFPFGCLALYPVLIAPDEWRRAWRWIRRMPPEPKAAVVTATEAATATATAAVTAAAAVTEAEPEPAAEAGSDAAPAPATSTP